MSYYRDYTCSKKFEHDHYVCTPGINYLSEAQTYEFYQILKVPCVEVHGIEGLIFGTSIYDKIYIKEKIRLSLQNPNLKIIFK